MKITIEIEDVTCIVSDDKAVDIYEAIELVRQALLGVGFHHNSVEEVIPDNA